MHKLTKGALVVSSCHARNCHPETCCCRDGEGAIMDYQDNGRGGQYYGVVQYGYRPDLETIVAQAKQEITNPQIKSKIEVKMKTIEVVVTESGMPLMVLLYKEIYIKAMVKVVYWVILIKQKN
jgi:hypothetical protein